MPKTIQPTEIVVEGSRISVAPDTAVSGEYETYQFRIRLGKGGLERRDSLGLICGSNTDRWHHEAPARTWGRRCPWQVENPKGANYTTVESNRADIPLELEIGGPVTLDSHDNLPNCFVRELH